MANRRFLVNSGPGLATPGKHNAIDSAIEASGASALLRIASPAFVCIAVAIAGVADVLASDLCSNRGELNAPYCDANQDLVADQPSDPLKFKSPRTLVVSFTPLENPAVYESAFEPFLKHLAQCTGTRTLLFPVQSNSAQIEAMRSGRLHLAFFSTGTTTYAVNQAGAVPFAVRADAAGPQGFHMILIARKSGDVKSIVDLKGRKVAHTSPSSMSGNAAPRALFPAMGITPGADYQVLYSGKHDLSILGVLSGKYDAAPVASDVFHQMATRGAFKEDDIRIVYSSERLPVNSLAYAHDLEPSFRDRIVQCVFNYRFDGELSRHMEGATHFAPITYLNDWAIIRRIEKISSQSQHGAPGGGSVDTLPRGQ